MITNKLHIYSTSIFKLQIAKQIPRWLFLEYKLWNSILYTIISSGNQQILYASQFQTERMHYRTIVTENKVTQS